MFSTGHGVECPCKGLEHRQWRHEPCSRRDAREGSSPVEGVREGEEGDVRPQQVPGDGLHAVVLPRQQDRRDQRGCAAQEGSNIRVRAGDLQYAPWPANVLAREQERHAALLVFPGQRQ